MSARSGCDPAGAAYSDDLAAVLNVLDDVQQAGIDYTAICPVHGDDGQRVKLQINGKGKVDPFCSGACTPAAVKAAISDRMRGGNGHSENGASADPPRRDWEAPPARIKRPAVNGNGNGKHPPAAVIERPEVPAVIEAAPFPLEALPEPLERMAREGADALPCPPDFLAVPMLTTCGAAIGRSRALRVKPGWFEGPRIWSAFVARPGDKKSPALEKAQKPMVRQQCRLEKLYEEEMSDFKTERARYEVEQAAWEKATKAGTAEAEDKPEEPDEPRMKQVFTTDSTTEAMCELVRDNPRGVIFTSDELAGWVRSMDQYHGGKGGDRQAWLKFWSGASGLVNRKGRKHPLFLKEPFVAVTGCLPPEVLGEFSDERGREDGFIHRILFSFPDPVEIRWSEAFISDPTADEYEKLLLGLANLQPDQDEDGADIPHVVDFTPEGKAAWVQWLNGHYVERDHPLFPDALRGPWAKMDGYCASLALIVHTVRSVIGLAAGEDVDAVSVKAAVEIIAYHKAHARRVYPMLKATEDDLQVSGAVRWIGKQDGRTTTARDIVRHNVGGVKRASEAKKLLCELAERGYGVTAEEAMDRLRFTLS